MRYFIKTSDNARILVEDLNSDSEKTILFIHGWPLNHNAYDSIALSASPWGTFKCLISLRDERLFNDITKIKIPTLILHGAHDVICPYEFGKYLHENIENSKLIPLSESGHGAFIEEKDKVNKSLLNFIENNN